MLLNECRHWVFDMDGTLTVAMHDFVAIKRELNVPQEADILHYLAQLPAAESAAKHAWLLEHERELALSSREAPGACELIKQLHSRGVRLGILTRNAHPLALLTLQAIGLAEYFDPADVLGRDEALPKPDPSGLQHLAARWAVSPAALVMVGDYAFDLQCAKAAGSTSVLVNLPDNPWPELSDYHALDCAQLAQWLG